MPRVSGGPRPELRVQDMRLLGQKAWLSLMLTVVRL